jgi:hypothetical protein
MQTAELSSLHHSTIGGLITISTQDPHYVWTWVHTPGYMQDESLNIKYLNLKNLQQCSQYQVIKNVSQRKVKNTSLLKSQED